MNVLIVGGGGREHALAWKAAQSPRVSNVWVAPGNAGTAAEPGVRNVAIGAEKIPELLRFAQEHSVDLTIIGPEAPLVEGIVDAFQSAGLACFGPTRDAARLEGSKAFCKAFLGRHGIPTADYQTFTNAEAACDYIRAKGVPIVVKADGLAAGKGVVVAFDLETALTAVADLLSLAESGVGQIVVEEFLEGEEVSFIVLADGKHVLPLATAQDHKARDDGDLGPNTGGMGAYSPAPAVTPELQARVLAEVIEPTLQGMAAEGSPYVGFLYAGLMITRAGELKVLEYNCRLGDPETQPILMRLQSDLVDLCLAALDGSLNRRSAQWDPRKALGVVIAAKGYPGDYPKGETIDALPDAIDDAAKLFHAGTQAIDGGVVTQGGRVFCATALGRTVAEAQRKAYALAEQVVWPNRYFRTDIGYRAVAREQSEHL